MRRRLGPRLLAAGLLCLAGCSSSAPAARVEAPVSDPAAVAARISGDWQLAIARGGRSVEGWLHFALGAGVLVGSLTGADNNSREISKITLSGDKISWLVESDSGRESYEGTLKGSSMEGTLKVSRGGGGAGADGKEAPPGRSGGGGSGGRRGGRGAGPGGGGTQSQVTWRAFRSVPAPPAATPVKE